MLPPRMNGEQYLRFLQETLFDYLEELPLQLRQRLWYQHDGAPPHFNRAVIDHLNATFPNRWIGRGGPVAWPPRSPDLTPLDFFLWGHLKNLVYSENGIIDSVEELVARVMAASEVIKTNPMMVLKSSNSVPRRCRLCVAAGGGIFENVA
uniref:Tc1-like transposase DDE domain-containing protein n=1 Tax=Photinus pyralis TaxID=7054 RepID=A0A1Y1L7H2_PHOPY